MSCSQSDWIGGEAFPLLFGALVGLVILYIALRPSSLLFLVPRVAADAASATAQQNRVYKRAGGVLVLLGAVGGFAPSLFLLARNGFVWSVNQQTPHPDVDVSLIVHILGAVTWIILAGAQLATGGVASLSRIHRVVGRLALVALLVGVTLSGGWIWTILHDFREGFRDGNAGAGLYTMTTASAAAINLILAVVYARRKDFARHKDFALMAIFWTLDPGVHRLCMWGMRALCWECWAPECTSGMGIAMAKLPANVFLVGWAVLTALRAGRMNRIVIGNAAGQYVLWTLGTFALLSGTVGISVATLTLTLALLVGASATIAVRRVLLVRESQEAAKPS